MPYSINLIKNRHTISEKDYQLERRVLQYSVTALVAIVVLGVSLAVTRFVFVTKLSNIEKQIATSTNELSNLTEASAQQIYLKSRLSLITGFLRDREVERQAIQSVFSIDIPNVIVSAARFENEDTMSIKLTSTDSESFSQALDYFSNESQFFTQAVSKNVSRNLDGEYTLDLLLTIPRS